MERMGLKGLEIIPSTFEETLDKMFATAGDYAMENAKFKALEVAQRVGLISSSGSSSSPTETLVDPPAPIMVIGADTVLEFEGIIYEKPKSREAAIERLTCLSGKEHHFVTGVAIFSRKYRYPGLFV